jgi:putative transposase
VAFSDDEERVRAERARAIGLFRYSLIREAADQNLSTKQRGGLVRALAEREHEGPFGQPVRASRATIDRWIRDWRRGGFDALLPTPRRVEPRTPADVLELAVALKKEVPARTAAQIAAILRAHSGWSPDERTLQRHFVRRELTTRPNGQPPQAFGRFEADQPNLRPTGDALHGPTVNGRKAILFAFLDDHSRLFTGYRWARREDTVRLEAALRTGIASRGIPASIYVDNGSAFVDKQLLRACASLGIRLVHSRPGQPAGRGKIERAFRTVRDQFLVEIGSGRELDDMVQLNTLFAAWVETVYHRRTHSETGQTPLDRWSVLGSPAPPSPAQLREAFLWSEWRTLTKTATVGLHGNTYEVDTALAKSTPPWSAAGSSWCSTRSTSPASRSVGTAGRWATPCRTRSAGTCTTKPDPTTRHRRRHRPASTTCAWSKPSTPPNSPNGCSTPSRPAPATRTATRAR